MTKEAMNVMDKIFRRNPQYLIESLPSLRDTLERTEEVAFRKGFEEGYKSALKRITIFYLHRKFEDVPASVVQRVESTKERPKLENWLQEMIITNSLAEMGLLPAKEPANGADVDTND
ncbi:MAG: hypothetical protein ACPGWR_15860 [Ardenticatenaceae bacterium]